MPMLPSPEQMDVICNECLKMFDEGKDIDVISMTNRIVAKEDIPMHSPCHHVLTCAVLLTKACMVEGYDREKLEKYLDIAKERAGQMPGAMCGYDGCCGAAVSAGIFTSIWLGATPLTKDSWSISNKVTAISLTAISEFSGPRCCKRNSYASILSAIKSIKELIGLNLGENLKYVCTFSNVNKTCLKEACAYYNKNA
ncbi:MAG: DUF5714 domain-containing protein [Clostridia bacterium]|nr:DUF5714 domain-containing protein [Clostridia bacterium]